MKRESTRRADILEAALRVIAERGVDAMTHRAVATSAGVSLAATTYYFDSKDALVAEALELVVDRSLELVRERCAVDGPISLPDLVERLIDLALAQLASERAPIVAEFELMLEAGRRPALRGLAERWSDEYAASIVDLVRAAGLGQPELRTAMVTCMLEGALLGQLAVPIEPFADAYLRPMLQRALG